MKKHVEWINIFYIWTIYYIYRSAKFVWRKLHANILAAVFYSEFRKRIIFHDSLICFCFIFNYWFSNNWFLNFFKIRFKYLNWTNASRRRIKIPIFFKKKYFFIYHGSFVINENVIFLTRITFKLNGQLF